MGAWSQVVLDEVLILAQSLVVAGSELPEYAAYLVEGAKTRCCRGGRTTLIDRVWTVPGFMDTGLGGEFVNAPIA